MKNLIQIAFAILVALQLIETFPSRVMARVFPDTPNDASGLPPNITVANKTQHHNSTKHTNHTKPTNSTKPVQPTNPTKPVEKPVVNPPKKPVNSFNNTDGKRDIPTDNDANSSNAAAKKPSDSKPVVDPKKQNALDKNKPFDPNSMPFDEGKFGHEKPTGGLDYYKPNFKLRITEKLAELAQEELLVYLQTYYNFDYPFEESGEFKINFFPVYTTVNYANLKMSPIMIDPYSFHFNFTKEIAANGKEKQYIYLQIPLIENWTADFDFTYKFFWIPITDNLQLQLNNVTANVQIELTGSTFGNFYPQIKKLKVDFGQSDIFSKNKFHQWWLRQTTNLIKYIMQNALLLFGPNCFNGQLPLWTKQYLQNQISKYPINIAQLNKTASFNVNWRLTEDPKIDNGLMDLAFFMDIGPDESYCSLPQQNQEYDFINGSENYFQLIITERMVNCALQAIERQNLLHYTVSSKYMVSHFGSHTFKINASMLSGAYPIISTLYGPTQELEVEIKIKKPTVRFGLPDNDVGFSMELDMGIKLADDMNFLIYDELSFSFMGDLIFEEEILFGEFSSLDLTQTGQNKGKRTLPIYNSMDMTEDHYQRFWQWAMKSTQDAKHFMNVDVLSYGVQLPYWKMELLTDTSFKPGAVLMMVDLFYNNQVQYADYLKSMSQKPEMSFSMFDNLPAPKFDVIQTLMSLLSV